MATLRLSPDGTDRDGHILDWDTNPKILPLMSISYLEIWEDGENRT